MKDILKYTYWNNSVQDYLIFVGALLVSLIMILIIKKIIVVRLKKWAKKTETLLDDVLVKMLGRYIVPLLFFGSIYFSSQLLTLSSEVSRIIYIIALAITLLYGSLALSNFLVFLFSRNLEKRNQSASVASVKWICVLIKIVIWVIALLLFLDNLNIEITALLAGLGVGGIALAFALNAVLQDLFSFVTIFFDRPFEIDDFIVVGDMKGNIEHIGIKTTRVKSLSGEQLIFSNKDLTNSRIRNYKRMETRRIAFSIGVTYNTPSEKLRLIPNMINEIITSMENIRFDRAHLKEFGDFAITFEIVYFVLSADYAIYMDINQEISFKIKDAFDNHGIEFAFPTQTIYLEKQ